MPTSRKNKTRKKRQRRVKREVVGARDAGSGEFVEMERLETDPDTTVAVTRPVESEDQEPRDRDGDEEC